MAIKYLKLIEMKKILIYILIAVSLASCNNKDFEYPDYTYQTVFFPVQYPIRSIVLGESRYDNSIDLEHAFTIGVSMGGVYKNTKDRVVKVKYAPELVTGSTLVTSKGDTVRVLPTNYYTPDPTTIDQIIIPAGSFDGRVKIQLNDNFFKDPKTVGFKYVIPLVILSETTEDSVLSGRLNAVIPNPNRNRTIDWQSGYLPKDFTLYGVKYTNKYHGNYFHYGVDSIFKANALSSVKRYRALLPDSVTTNVTGSNITKLTTVSLTENTIDRLGGTNVGNSYKIKLKMSDTVIAIDTVAGGAKVIGSGIFKKANEGVAWGGERHNTIILSYSFTNADGLHKCKDTLVYRSNAIVYEDFTIDQVKSVLN